MEKTSGFFLKQTKALCMFSCQGQGVAIIVAVCGGSAGDSGSQFNDSLKQK